MASLLGPSSRISVAAPNDFLWELTRIFGDADEATTTGRDLDRLRKGTWVSLGAMRTLSA